ncbi:hypothetical protein [Hyphomonas sp.]|uniref:hypothetical protein n=1 Tax=Hyphomonas sp. TaxID=87 RepID=UPI0032ED1102|tara:strand:+ start:3297 stop:3551 length:255 start_codon:yes stop_codon:yes gene_type:complete
MPRKTLDAEARPHTSPAEADQIETAANHRRAQMLPGEGPHAPDRDTPVDHFKGGDNIILGSEPEAASYTATPQDSDEDDSDSND